MKKLVSRRWLLERILLPMAIALSVQKWGPRADEDVRRAAEDFHFGSRPPPHQALELLGLRHQTTHFFAGPGHSLFPGRTHPADEFGLLTIAGRAGFADALRKGRVHFDAELPADVSGSLVFVGGTNSQVIPRAVFQYEGPDSDHLNRPHDAILPLFFSGISDRDRVEKRKQILGDGRLAEGPVWGFEDRDGNVYKPRFSGDHRRESDWLLITRLANFLDVATGQTEHSIIYVEGASGAGTMAIEHFLDDEPLLKYIESRAGDQFQALIKVTELEYRDRVVRPRGLGDPRIVPLKIDQATYQRANAAAMQGLDRLHRDYRAGQPA